jgi:hypothetical protein
MVWYKERRLFPSLSAFKEMQDEGKGCEIYMWILPLQLRAEDSFAG